MGLDSVKNAAISLGKSALSGAINSAAGTATSMLALRRAGFLDMAKNAAVSLGKSALSGAINSAAGTATSMLANRRALLGMSAAAAAPMAMKFAKGALGAALSRRRAGFLDAAKNAAISL